MVRALVTQVGIGGEVSLARVSIEWPDQPADGATWLTSKSGVVQPACLARWGSTIVETTTCLYNLHVWPHGVV